MTPGVAVTGVRACRLALDSDLNAQLTGLLAGTGLILRGALREDGAPGAVATQLSGRDRAQCGATGRDIALVGNAGTAMWDAMQRAGAIGASAHPIDDWSRRHLERVAAAVRATFIHPNDTPYAPFQAWALVAEDVFPSPVGWLISPRYGLWHAYRGALIFDRPVGTPATATAATTDEALSPCVNCKDRPCLSTCPVSAFAVPGDDGATRYDVAACRSYLANGPSACRGHGCQARAACPVGTPWEIAPAQAAHHVAALLNAGAGNSL